LFGQEGKIINVFVYEFQKVMTSQKWEGVSHFQNGMEMARNM